MAAAWSEALEGNSRIAFDTNALIYFLEDFYPYSDRVAEALRMLSDGVAVGFASTIVEMEMLVGPLRQRDRRLLMNVRKFFNLQPNLHLTPLNSDIARAAAEVRAETGMKAPDAIIAATAAANRCDVVIGNDRAFAGRCPVPYLVLDDFTA